MKQFCRSLTEKNVILRQTFSKRKLVFFSTVILVNLFLGCYRRAASYFFLEQWKFSLHQNLKTIFILTLQGNYKNLNKTARMPCLKNWFQKESLYSEFFTCNANPSNTNCRKSPKKGPIYLKLSLSLFATIPFAFIRCQLLPLFCFHSLSYATTFLLSFVVIYYHIFAVIREMRMWNSVFFTCRHRRNIIAVSDLDQYPLNLDRVKNINKP